MSRLLEIYNKVDILVGMLEEWSEDSFTGSFICGTKISVKVDAGKGEMVCYNSDASIRISDKDTYYEIADKISKLKEKKLKDNEKALKDKITILQGYIRLIQPVTSILSDILSDWRVENGSGLTIVGTTTHRRVFNIEVLTDIGEIGFYEGYDLKGTVSLDKFDFEKVRNKIVSILNKDIEV